MNLISVIVPGFKRIDQTLRSINLLLSSKSLNNIKIELIVADSTPDNSLEIALKKEFGDRLKYTRPELDGIAANKNQGARSATGEIIIFCDSDIEVEEDTLINTLKSLEEHKTAGAVGGQVFWKTGDKNGTLDRPRSEDRMEKIGDTTYVEAIYSRYLATYNKVFWSVGGYDEKVFNMRGEGSDLSIRYWRAGFPLTFDEIIKVHHVHDASDSAALRVSHPEWGVAKDLVLLAYKYDMLDGEYNNFQNTLNANFQQFGDKAFLNFLQGIGKNMDFISRMKPVIDEEKKSLNTLYDFKFLEIFSNKELFEKCIKEAEERINKFKGN